MSGGEKGIAAREESKEGVRRKVKAEKRRGKGDVRTSLGSSSSTVRIKASASRSLSIMAWPSAVVSSYAKSSNSLAARARSGLAGRDEGWAGAASAWKDGRERTSDRRKSKQGPVEDDALSGSRRAAITRKGEKRRRSVRLVGCWRKTEKPGRRTSKEGTRNSAWTSVIICYSSRNIRLRDDCSPPPISSLFLLPALHACFSSPQRDTRILGQHQ
jgi:hypothetical protein